MKKFCVLTSVFLLCVVSSVLSQMTLKGKVMDAKTGRALIGATVRIEQTTIGSATNMKGDFVLKQLPDGEYTLRASFAGYDPETLKINKANEEVVFKLKPAMVNLNQVVVTGTGTHRRLKDSPVAVEVINASDIRNAGIATIEDALTMLNPSFDFRPTLMGSNMTMNGMKNKHVLIMVDGRRMNGDVSGNTDLSRVDMSRVKRIEILKGAASSLYGSDAMGGVINIITEQPHDRLNVVSNTRYGSHGNFMENINVDVNAGKFSSATSYQRRQMDSWRLSDEALEGKKPKDVTDKFFSNSVSQRFVFDATERLGVYAQGSYFNKETDRKAEEDEYNLSYMNYNAGLGGKYLFGHGAYVSLDVYMDNYEYSNVYLKDVKPIKEADEVLTKRQRNLNANLRGVFRAGEYNKLTVGTEYFKDYLKNPGSLGESKNVYTYSLYAQDEIRLWKKLQLIPGFRYVYHEQFKNHFTPKLALMYSLGDFNLRTSWSSGFKAPRLEEMYYYKEKKGALSVGNPYLKPEKSNSYSLNAEYVGRLLNLSATAYRNDVKNIIILRNANETMTPEEAAKFKEKKLYVNVDKARVQGFDANVNSYLGAGFSVGGGYGFVDAKDRNTDRMLEGTVKHTGTVKAGWMHEWNKYRLNVNVNGRIQGEKYFYSEDKKGNITDESAVRYNLWNLTTTHSFGAAGHFLFDLNMGIENLFDFTDDRPYGVNYGTLTPGRTYFAGLIVRFKK